MKERFIEKGNYTKDNFDSLKYYVTETLSYMPTIALGAMIGLGIGGFAYAGASLDQFWNPQIIDALREHTYWYQFLTSKHALTPVIVDHPQTVLGIPTFIGVVSPLFRNKY